MSFTDAKPLMTRKQTLEFLHSLGFPMTETYFNKICLPSRNAGPPPATLWGSRPLYDADQVFAWAQSRCRPATQQERARGGGRE